MRCRRRRRRGNREADCVCRGIDGAVAALIVVYLTALLLAELLHHNAAAALMFPIAVETANLVARARAARIPVFWRF